MPDSAPAIKSGALPARAKLKHCSSYFLLVIAVILVGGCVVSLIESSPNVQNVKAKEEELKAVEAYFDNNETVLRYLREHYHVFDEDRDNLQWDFHNSIFFAFTVATTIGYGNVAPQTVSGKMFTAVYALIAIPLVGSCLVALADTALYFMRKAIASCTINGMRKAFDAIDKDNSKSLDKKEVKLVLKELSIDVDETVFNATWDEVAKDADLDFEQFLVFRKKIRFDVSEVTLQRNKTQITLAAIFCWVIISTGIIGLAERWTFADSLYFSVVTLTTIGLGDFVPQSRAGKDLTMLTCVVGLGLITTLLTNIGESIEEASKSVRRRASSRNKKNGAKQYLEITTATESI